MKGNTPGIGSDGPQEAFEPTSPRNVSWMGSISIGRPTSQVVNRRPFQGSGAVFDMFIMPKGESMPGPTARNTSGFASCRRTDGDSIRRARHAKRSGAAPKLPGRSESRTTWPGLKSA